MQKRPSTLKLGVLNMTISFNSSPKTKNTNKNNSFSIKNQPPDLINKKYKPSPFFNTERKPLNPYRSYRKNHKESSRYTHKHSK